MAIAIEDYVHLEEGVADFLYSLWRKRVEPMVGELEAAAERGDVDLIVNRLNSIDVQSIAQEAEPAVRNHVYASYVFGGMLQTPGDEDPQPPPPEFRSLIVDAVVDSYLMAFDRLRDRMVENVGVFLPLDGPQEPVQKVEACFGHHHTPVGVLLLKAAPMTAAEKMNAVVMGQAKVAFEAEANINTSRLVSYGFLSEALSRNMKTYQISAVLDDRTCPVCQVMHGKVFNTQVAHDFFLKVLQLTDPEEKKLIAPFPKSSKAGVAELLSMTPDQMEAAGVMAPPFHPLCRCRQVPVGEVDPTEILPVAEPLPGQTDKDFVLSVIPTPEQLAAQMGKPLTPEFEAARTVWGPALKDHEVNALEAIFNNADINVWKKLCAGPKLVHDPASFAFCAAFNPNVAGKVVTDADNAIKKFELSDDIVLTRYATGDVAADIYNNWTDIDGAVIMDKGWVVASVAEKTVSDTDLLVKIVIKAPKGAKMIKVGKSYSWPSSTAFQVYSSKMNPDATITLYAKMVDEAQAIGAMPPPITMPNWAKDKLTVQNWKWYKDKGFSDEYIWNKLQETTKIAVPAYTVKPYPGIGASDDAFMAALPPNPEDFIKDVKVPAWVDSAGVGLTPDNYKHMWASGKTRKELWDLNEKKLADFYGGSYTPKPFPSTAVAMPPWAKQLMPEDDWWYYKDYLDYSDQGIWEAYHQTLKNLDPDYVVPSFPGTITTAKTVVTPKAIEPPFWVKDLPAEGAEYYQKLKAKNWAEKDLWDSIEAWKKTTGYTNPNVKMVPYPGDFKVPVPWWATGSHDATIHYKYLAQQGYVDGYIHGQLKAAGYLEPTGKPLDIFTEAHELFEKHPLSLDKDGIPIWVNQHPVLKSYMDDVYYTVSVNKGQTPQELWEYAAQNYSFETGKKPPVWPGLAEVQSVAQTTLEPDFIPPWAQIVKDQYKDLYSQGKTPEEIWDIVYDETLKDIIGPNLKSTAYPGTMDIPVPYWAAANPQLTEAYKYYSQLWGKMPENGLPGVSMTDQKLFQRLVKFSETVGIEMPIKEWQYPGPHMASMHPLSLNSKGIPIWVEQGKAAITTEAYLTSKASGWTDEYIWDLYHKGFDQAQPFPGYGLDWSAIPYKYQNMDVPDWVLDPGGVGKIRYQIIKSWETVDDKHLWALNESLKATADPSYEVKPWALETTVTSEMIKKYPVPEWAKDANITPTDWAGLKDSGFSDKDIWDYNEGEKSFKFGKGYEEKPFPGADVLKPSATKAGAPQWFLGQNYTQEQWDSFKKLNNSDEQIWDLIEMQKSFTGTTPYEAQPYPGEAALKSWSPTEWENPKAVPVVPAGAKLAEDLKAKLGDDFVEYGDLEYHAPKPGGSIPGDTRVNPVTGEKWIIKEVKTEDIARNEVLTAKLYKAAGLDVPDLRLVHGPDGKVWVASKWLDGFEEIPGVLQTAERVPELYENFAVDAWLSNWDVVGASYDNIGLLKGKAFRIDVGGGLRYRAQGALKTAAQFTDHVQDLDNMRNPSLSPLVSKVFGDIKQSELLTGVRRITSIPDSEIRALVSQYGPIDPSLNSELAERMIARKRWLVSEFGEKGIAPGLLNKVVPVADTSRVTDLEYDLIKDSRLNGYSFRTDIDQIEGQNALIHMEQLADGTPVTQLTLKVRGDKARELTEMVTSNLKGQAPVGEYMKAYGNIEAAKNALDEKTVSWAKGFFSRVDAGEAIRAKEIERYDDLFSQYSTFKKEIGRLKSQMAGLEGLDAADLRSQMDDLQAHYSAYVGSARRAMMSAQKEGNIATWDDAWGDKLFKPKAIADSNFKALDLKSMPLVPDEGLKFEKVDNLNYKIKEWKRGRAVQTGDTYRVSGTRYIATDGKFEIEFVPHSNSTQSRVAGRSLENQLVIRVTGQEKVDVESLFEELDKLGIRSSRSTELDQKYLYYKELAYLDKKDWKKFGDNTSFNTLPVADQVEQMEAYFLDKFNMSPDETVNMAYGRDQIFMQGMHYRERPDLQGPEWDSFSADYKLIHDQQGGGSFSELLEKMLDNGGRWAPTNDRMRMGIPLGNAGMSPDTDIRSGGANYFFYRIYDNENAIKGGSSKARLVMNTNPLRRTDTISYPGDKYGQVSDTNFIQSNRATTIDEYKKLAGYGSQTNETIVKGGQSLFDPDLQYIILSQQEIERAKKVLIDHGFNMWPDGRAFDDVMKTGEAAAEHFRKTGGVIRTEYAGPVPVWAQDDEGLYKALKSKGDSDLAIQKHMTAKGYSVASLEDAYPGYVGYYHDLQKAHPEWSSKTYEDHLQLAVADPSTYPDWLKTTSAARKTYAEAKRSGMTEAEIFTEYNGSIVK